jgi:SMI1 / KNR4 family (SUKH-1)
MNIRLDSCTPATSEDLLEAECDFGALFPADYRAFLLRYNGAIPEENVSRDDPNINVIRFLPLSISIKQRHLIEGFPINGWPIAEAPSGNYVYIRNDSLSVFFWDHEIDQDKKIAGSFGEFLDSLEPFDSDSIELKPEQIKSVWVDPDFKPKF